jgi:hypothetical protein
MESKLAATNFLPSAEEATACPRPLVCIQVEPEFVEVKI